MTWILLIVIVIALIAISSTRSRTRMTSRDVAQRQPVSAEQLEAVKRAADEDVTVFGEDLRALDADLAGRELDAMTRQDYQRALDGYEDAKQSVAAVNAPDQIRHVTEILEDGRYAVACVRARVAGAPLPERRPPCFFNPQHGPSVRDVQWTPAGGTVREVPVCAADADRIASGAEPMTRQVMVGPQRLPYWQAGPAFQPWTMGYFGAFGAMEMLFVGTMMGGMFAGGFGDNGYDAGYDSGYDQGYDAGQDQGADQGGYDDGSGGYDDGGGYDGGGGYDDGGGGYDGGGFDGGGYDGGGFDGGGFDGGGFDGGGF
jgi:uncharacterized membrane protein YgcG